MSRRPAPRPRPQPVPRPAPVPVLTSETEQVLDDIGFILDRLVNVAPGSGSSTKFETETVVFEFAAATVQAYTVQRDGYIIAVRTNKATTYVTVNVAPPADGSINGGTTKIWTGLVYGTGVLAAQDQFFTHARIRGATLTHTVPDVIMVRAPLGAVCELVMSYDI